MGASYYSYPPPGISGSLLPSTSYLLSSSSDSCDIPKRLCTTLLFTTPLQSCLILSRPTVPHHHRCDPTPPLCCRNPHHTHPNVYLIYPVNRSLFCPTYAEEAELNCAPRETHPTMMAHHYAVTTNRSTTRWLQRICDSEPWSWNVVPAVVSASSSSTPTTPTTSPTSFRSLLTPSSPAGFSPLRYLHSLLVSHLSTSAPSTM